MQTIDIAQAIKDNSANVSQNLDPSVLEGLIGNATKNKDGLIDKKSYLKIEQTSLSDKVIKLLDISDMGVWKPYMFIIRTSTTDLNINGSFICYGCITGKYLSAKIKKLFSISNPSIKFYNSNNKLYFKTIKTEQVLISGLSIPIEKVEDSEISGVEPIEVI